MTITKKQLDLLIQQGESYNLEFKEGYSKEIGREICAFANANGGKILVGVTDEGKVQGFSDSNSKRSQIQGLVRNIEPTLDITFYVVENVLVLEVPEGLQKPYSLNGKFYMRTGANSQQLKRDEVKEFFKKEGRIFFDELGNDSFSVEQDIDEEAFSRFKKFLGVSDVLDRKELLNNLDLLDNSQLKNAGVLLFSKRVTRFIRTATITCVLYQGFDKNKVLDRKEYDADIYSNFTEAINYLRSKLNTEYIIKGGPREERLELPEEALREAVLNAIAHRDYYSTGNIQVGIYKDRVEIDNPGGLVGKMKVEELFGRSLPRNPLLFGLMQRMNLVEKIGSGLMRMRNAVKEYSLPDIALEADENWFKIIFRRLEEKPAGQDEEKPREEIREETREKTREEPREETREKILNLIKENPKITMQEMAKEIGISEKGIEWNIDRLKEKGVIERKGPKRGGYWEIKR